MPSAYPTHFDSVLDLARLPWFERRGECDLAVADPAAVGPIIDMHTHLALSYARKRCPVDLGASHPCTQHYLPVDSSLDLDVYVNRNFSEARLAVMKRDLVWRAPTGRGLRATHTAPQLRREMDLLGVRHSVLLAIELPWVASHNAEDWLDAVRGDDRFIVFGSVHPLDRDARRRLESQAARGIRGVKFHPAVQNMRPDHPRALELYAWCRELGLPVLFHCGPVGIETAAGRKRSQLKHYWPAIEQFPDVTFVLGHAGALQWPMALRLARCYDNVWLEVSCIALSALRRVLAEGPTDRVVFGSDWPFYHQAIPLAKVLLATEGDEPLRRRVLFDNAARLLRLAA